MRSDVVRCSVMGHVVVCRGMSCDGPHLTVPHVGDALAYAAGRILWDRIGPPASAQTLPLPSILMQGTRCFGAVSDHWHEGDE